MNPPIACNYTCRICGRPGIIVETPPGFSVPDRDNIGRFIGKTLVLCQWHRGADTRRAKALGIIGNKLQEAMDQCGQIMDEYRGKLP